MTQLRCEGSSDDTFGVYCDGNQGDDYDNCASGKPIAFLITAGLDAMLVVGQYGLNASSGWLIGVAPVEHDNLSEPEIPAWPMRFERSERPYSPVLLIDVPEPFTIRHVEE